MKKNKGFTLVELLAVIAILGIVVIVVSVNVIGAKKDANIKEIKMIEEQIAKIGPDYILENNSVTFPARIGIASLSNYLNLDNSNKIKSPFGNNKTCSGYLLINKSGDEYDFKGFVDCGSDYKTTGYGS